MAERQKPEPLPGVASTDQWEILYKAAKQYSEEIAYPGESFPKTDDAVCVLCQQPLDEDAVVRFGRFKKFMEDSTNTVLAAKSNALTLPTRKLGRFARAKTRQADQLKHLVHLLYAPVAKLNLNQVPHRDDLRSEVRPLGLVTITRAESLI